MILVSTVFMPLFAFIAVRAVNSIDTLNAQVAEVIINQRLNSQSLVTYSAIQKDHEARLRVLELSRAFK